MENNQQYLDNLRHSCAHLLAAAVMDIWPDTKRTIGPSIENGFYFDFQFSKPISEKDFVRIEQKMHEISKTWKSFERHELSPQDAKKEYPGNEFKHELIEEFAGKGEKLSFYKSGDYWDLCRGGHVEHPDKELKHFKLLSLAGAYWRGDEKNPMLTRIYGTVFPSKEELDKYLWQLEEAKKRDHRKIGQELDLFFFSDLVGSGLPLWTPRGTIMRNELDQFVWELRQAKGYQRVAIPHITKKALYETSGHWAKFATELFRIKTREGDEFAMKPMNCPHHTQIFAHLPRSYRDMPQRYAETTMVYRDEQSGELSGLSRVRCITQDDAHVFCRESQIKQEFFAIWDIVNQFYSAFGFELKVRLSFHDPEQFEKYLGTPEIWKKAEDSLEEIAKARKADYFIGKGEAAMYGPKMDFMAHDSLGRQLQVATIQLDMNLPERFDLSCTNEKGEKERVVMLHAAIMGSIERFCSAMIEHTAGAFPVWLSPEQVRIIPISEANVAYADKLKAELDQNNIRNEVDSDGERMQNKIRKAQALKIPYMLIIGKQEEADNTVSLRYRNGKELKGVKFVDFVEKISKNIRDRVLDIDLE